LWVSVQSQSVLVRIGTADTGSGWYETLSYRPVRCGRDIAARQNLKAVAIAWASWPCLLNSFRDYQFAVCSTSIGWKFAGATTKG
jgi:hypothetical protein